MNNQRNCSHCRTPITNVYIFDQGEYYACSDECRDHISESVYQSDWNTLSKDYDKDEDEFVTSEDFYYTEFN